MIILNDYQEILLHNGWNIEINPGILRPHFYYHKRIKGKLYSYYDDINSAEMICKKHKIKVI